MISHKHQCLFVHIPKTAGNSINRVFGVGWENHKDLARYHAEIPHETFERYFKFAVVRNPWDRLLSDYNYQKKKSREKASKLFMFEERGRERDFAAWIEAALATPDFYEPESWGGEVSPHIHRWSPQVDWIEVDGVSRVDFVARLENLSHDFREVCDRLNLREVRLPHRNRRLHWHYSHYYDRTTRDIVADYYARDIQQFGYEYEHAVLRVAVRWPFSAQRTRPSLNDTVAAPTGSVDQANPAPPIDADATATTRSIPTLVPQAANPRNPNPVPTSHPVSRPSPRPAPKTRWRSHLALAASFALIAGVLTLAAFSSGKQVESRDLVRNVMQRGYAVTTQARSTPGRDPFVTLIHRATNTDFHYVPLGTGGFMVIPITTPPAPPQGPAVYGLLPGPIPPADSEGRPMFRWRSPRS